VAYISSIFTPKELYEHINKNHISKFEAIHILFSLIEECNLGDTRVEYVNLFEKLSLKNKKVFNFIENLLISDESEAVRATAAKVIVKLFPEDIVDPLKWIIQNDNSSYVLTTINNLIRKIDNQYSDILNTEYLKRLEAIALNYGVILKEAEFLMDIGLNPGFHRNFDSNSKRNVIYGNNVLVITKKNHVRAISLSNWKPESLPESISNLEKLKYLNLSCNELKLLPTSIDELSQLKFLDLGWNKFQSIPSFLAKVKSVKNFRLDLDHNEIKSIPKWIDKLESLNYLNLRNNQIKEIPDSIGNLKNLEYLDLRENQIELIPESIGLNTSLKVIWLNNNKIKYIPKSIGSLKLLEVLDLGNNVIQEIPEEISKLKSLEYLNLKNNQIKEIQESIKALDGLKSFKV